ncbi:hypothetical protein EIP86_002202 [Pleurotus ostreatoroseus]|nr:hypothetical protein EIP86_002202 [Pleurotus ostreatoroseus]
MADTRLRTLLLLLLLVSAVLVADAGAEPQKTLSVLDTDIAQCEPVQQLSVLKHELEANQSPIMRTVFSFLFPFGPGWNSVPNFILAFIPAEINHNTLNTMTAFATGGLLSDVFLHLVPHAFMGEHQDGGVHFVMVQEKRNILIGLGIFVGFGSFFVMEKTLRVLGGGGEDSEGHSHSHSHSQSQTNDAHASGISTTSAKGELRSRVSKAGEDDSGKDEHEHEDAQKTGPQPSKLSAYLNLFGDFVHNMMAASFYSSPLIGATTTLACFAHEIPHEIADYSILVRSGFTKRQAMQSQFITAIGAFVSRPPYVLLHVAF